MNIRPVEAMFFHAGDGLTERRTDMTKLIIAFRKFATTLKKKRL